MFRIQHPKFDVNGTPDWCTNDVQHASEFNDGVWLAQHNKKDADDHPDRDNAVSNLQLARRSKDWDRIDECNHHDGCTEKVVQQKHQTSPKLPRRANTFRIEVTACCILQAFCNEHHADQMGSEVLVPFQVLIFADKAERKAAQGH